MDGVERVLHCVLGLPEDIQGNPDRQSGGQKHTWYTGMCEGARSAESIQSEKSDWIAEWDSLTCAPSNIERAVAHFLAEVTHSSQGPNIGLKIRHMENWKCALSKSVIPRIFRTGVTRRRVVYKENDSEITKSVRMAPLAHGQ